MSSDTERLWWERGRGGVARLFDVQVSLPGHVQPGLDRDMPQLDVLDYAPDSGCVQLQPVGERRRDMDHFERAACARFLQRRCMQED